MGLTRIGLVGCGAWGKYILKDLVGLGCEVHVVARSQQGWDNALKGQADSIVSEIAQLPMNLDGYVVAVTTLNHFAQ